MQKLDQTSKTHKMVIMIPTQVITNPKEEQMVPINEVRTTAEMITTVNSIANLILMDLTVTREMKGKSTGTIIETEEIEGLEMKESGTETIEIVEMIKMKIAGKEEQIGIETE